MKREECFHKKISGDVQEVPIEFIQSKPNTVRSERLNMLIKSWGWLLQIFSPELFLLQQREKGEGVTGENVSLVLICCLMKTHLKALVRGLRVPGFQLSE